MSFTTTSLQSAPVACADSGYVTSGPIGELGDDRGDVGQIVSIALEPVDGCERITIDFATSGGAPATRVPVTRVELLDHIGIVRMSFGPSVQSTALAESTFEGSLAERAYVVRGLDGRLFVDVLLAGAAEARAVVEQTPAQLLIELRGIEGTAPGRPAVSEFVVVTEPLAAPVEFPIEVAGYARTSEGNVVGRLTSDNGVQDEQVTTAAAYIETWGAFLLTLDAEAEGSVELFVGSDSSVDGIPVGVTIELTGR